MTNPMIDMMRTKLNKGKLILVDLESWPEAWGQVKPEFKKQWSSASINSARLSALLSQTNHDNVKDWIRWQGSLECFSRWRKWYFSPVENDSMFPCDYSYVVAFYQLYDLKQARFSERDYIKHWFKMNKKSLKYNLAPGNPNNTVGLYRARILQEEGNDISEEKVIALIKRGAVYRAGKTYAAMLRELYFTTGLTVPRVHPVWGEISEVTVGVHPLIDLCLHADGILVTESDEAILSAYLNTSNSLWHGGRKNQGSSPQSMRFINGSVKNIPFEGIIDGVSVPSDARIRLIQASAHAIPEAMTVTNAGIYGAK